MGRGPQLLDITCCQAAICRWSQALAIIVPGTADFSFLKISIHKNVNSELPASAAGQHSHKLDGLAAQNINRLFQCCSAIAQRLEIESAQLLHPLLSLQLQ